MTTRMMAAGLIAAVGIAAALVPAQGAGRGGGGLHVGPAPAPGALRAPMVRPVMPARPAAGAPRTLDRGLHVQGTRFGPGRSRIAAPRSWSFGPGWYGGYGGYGGDGVYGGDGGYYAPSNYVLLHDLPPGTDLSPDGAGGPPAPYLVPMYRHRRGCSRDVQTVPREGGGSRDITIVRC